jgi:hypothetical protein
MNEKISEAILVPWDIKCGKCECKREAVHGGIGQNGEPLLRDENCTCGHSLPADHDVIRETKSDFEKQRDGEL